ncbi:MAG: twin-arginine translocation signal domain-containing protein [Marmoricola sp.]
MLTSPTGPLPVRPSVPPSRRRFVRTAGAAAALLAVGGVLTGCGSSSGSSADASGAPEEAAVTARPTPASAQPSGTVIRVHITGDSVDPSGSRVQVSAGKPVTLLITATAPGELHVHSTPEQHIEYPKGTSAAVLTLDQPGVVEVESHALEKTIVQLEVR